MKANHLMIVLVLLARAGHVTAQDESAGPALIGDTAMKKNFFFFSALLLVACGGKYKAPTALPKIDLPPGADLKRFDPDKPGLPRPPGLVKGFETFSVEAPPRFREEL